LKVEATENQIVIDGKDKIQVFSERDPS